LRETESILCTFHTFTVYDETGFRIAKNDYLVDILNGIAVRFEYQRKCKKCGYTMHAHSEMTCPACFLKTAMEEGVE